MNLNEPQLSRQPGHESVPIHNKNPKEQSVPKVWSQPLYLSVSICERQPLEKNDEN